MRRRVFRAERVEADFRQSVAIKLLRQELINPSLLKRFSAERTLLAALNHPGICRLIDAGAMADGTPYAVMELVDGEDLLSHADRHGLRLEQRLQLFRQVLSAVSPAHQHLVVHRDIKSGNIQAVAALEVLTTPAAASGLAIARTENRREFIELLRQSQALAGCHAATAKPVEHCVRAAALVKSVE